MTMQAFTGDVSTVLVTAGAASANIALPGKPAISHQVRLVNAGPNLIYVGFGGSAVTASIPTSTPSQTSLPIPISGTNGAATIVSIPPNVTHIAYIRETADSRLIISVGEGSVGN